MCGIAGFIGFDNKIELAEKANIIQKHRGPDNQSVWFDKYIALSHQRLSIIDLSENANQPFEKNGYVIVFNGEIYNYKELKEELNNKKNINYITTSDTEVVLEYYIHYKEKSLNYFRGMFAFSIYNKNTQELFIARDQFGIKPLFYTKVGDCFAFASELKTLVNIPGFDKSINMKSLIASLNYLWIPGNETMFSSCFKLSPAHYLTYKKGELNIVKYWELEDNINLDTTEEEFTKNLSKILEDSIEKHMVADVPVSAFLSGGLDSSLICVLANNHIKELSTYTIGTSKVDKKIEQMPEDEKYARILAEKFNFNHNEIIINSDIVDILPKMVYALDEPIGDPAAINTFLICNQARKKGVKVLLSGMGADEIFFGYRRQKANILAQKYRTLPIGIRKLINITVKNLPVKFNGKGLRLSRWAKKFISFAGLPADEGYRMSYSYYNPEFLKLLLKNKYTKEVDTIIEEHNKLFNSKYKGDIINQMCYTDINYFMIGLNLTYSDRASMLASVELRVPFIDIDVIKYGMKIPGILKYKKNQSKYILKKASEKYLPKEIIYRPKASFGAPIRSWISGDLKPMVDDLLSKESIKKRGILDEKIVWKMIEDDRKGIIDYAYQIYQLLTLELWFREYIDNK